MRLSLHKIAVLLLGAVCALPGTFAGAASAAGPRVHPAGCHDRHPATPFPTPVSFQCCVNGHHAALPNASFTVGSQDARTPDLVPDFQVRIELDSDRNSVHVLFPSNSPPGTSPLRI